MKLSFIPGKLYLLGNEDGSYSVMLKGGEILRTRSQRGAVAKFNKVRQEIEAQFPAHQMTDEDKAELLRRSINESLVQHNSLGGRQKKTTAGGTRTFGG